MATKKTTIKSKTTSKVKKTTSKKAVVSKQMKTKAVKKTASKANAKKQPISKSIQKPTSKLKTKTVKKTGTTTLSATKKLTPVRVSKKSDRSNKVKPSLAKAAKTSPKSSAKSKTKKATMKVVTESKSRQIGYFYQPKVKRALWIILIVSCIISVALELLIKRHSHFADHGWQAMDGIFGFYAAMGFVGCVGLILIAKLLGVFLKVRENFYDESNG